MKLSLHSRLKMLFDIRYKPVDMVKSSESMLDTYRDELSLVGRGQ